MRKVLAILLLSIYVFGATDAYQALKLPKLVQHYIMHKHEDPSITLAAFLHMHYQDKLIVDDDFQQDQQLPFKQIPVDFCLTVSPLLPANIHIQKPTEEEPPIQHSVKNEIFISRLEVHNIFQPPKA